MNRINTLLFFLFLLPNYNYCQETMNFTIVKTNTSEIRIPGNWEKFNIADDSGQIYFKNKEGIIIAIAQNYKKAYEFYKSNKSDFENVKAFYKWDSDYRKENKFKTDKLKENAALEYIIWKFNDGKIDNVFLFGSSKDTFLNLLVYSDTWSESEKIIFLEKLFQLNK